MFRRERNLEKLLHFSQEDLGMNRRSTLSEKQHKRLFRVRQQKLLMGGGDVALIAALILLEIGRLITPSTNPKDSPILSAI